MAAASVIVTAGAQQPAPIVTAGAQEPAHIEARAEQIFRAACQYLAEAPYFSLTAEIWREHMK